MQLKYGRKKPKSLKQNQNRQNIRRKTENRILVLTNQQCKIKEDGSFKFPKLLGLDVKTSLMKKPI
jgi:hypothetical protein